MIPLLALALGADVYVNGVRADVLPVTTLTGVTVRFDAAGNVWIDAPTYAASTRDVAPAVSPGSLSAAPVATVRAASGSTGTGPPSGSWWLVTDDAGSVGQSLEVYVNEVLVRRVASGEPQVLLDLGAYLHPGPNTVRIVARPPAAAPAGALSVYVGRGSATGDTVRIATIDLRYSRRAEDGLAGSVKEYTVLVP